MPRIIDDSDSDEEEDLSLERSATPQDPLADENLYEGHMRARGARSPSCDELSRACRGSPRELRDASASNDKKRKRDDAGTTARDDEMKANEDAVDAWDVPLRRSPTPPGAARPTTERDELAITRRMTSSEIRRKHEDTPTEPATSSTSSNGRVVLELAGTTGSSSVSLEGFDSRRDHRREYATADIENGTDSISQPPHPSDSVVVLLRQSKAAELKRSPKRLQEEEDNQSQDDGFVQPDELAIGLPNERYVPRPSRRRAAAAQEQAPVPYLTMDGTTESRSERTRTAGTKRRKTTSDAKVLDSAISDGTAQLVDMGFSPTRAEASLREVNGDVERATDMLLNGVEVEQQEAVHDEVDRTETAEEAEALPMSDTALQVEQDDMNTRSREKSPQKVAKTRKSPGKKRGRPKKNMKQDTELQEASQEQHQDMAPAEDGHSPAKQSPPEAAQASSPLPSPPKKRGRGRPKKGVTVTSEEVVRDEDEPTETCPEQMTENPDADAEKENAAGFGERQVEEDKTAQLSSASSPVQKAMAAPSPAGRPAYRVGLSKRMKLPSLLRSVKK